MCPARVLHALDHLTRVLTSTKAFAGVFLLALENLVKQLCSNVMPIFYIVHALFMCTQLSL
jgi:hypothetical protein